MNLGWTRPFEPDEHTVVLCHFDEGQGNEAHDSCGDPELALRAERALWGFRLCWVATTLVLNAGSFRR